MKKWKIWGIVVLFFLIFLFFFMKNNYKNFKFGHNESNKSVKEVEEYILNVNSYEATVEVTVNSNKNTNKYLLKQEQDLKNTEKKQIVLKPENIAGVELKSNNGNLTVTNSRLNLNQMYTDYPDISDNILWLGSFIEYYKNNKNKTSIYEEHGDIVMEIKNMQDRNIGKRKLYLEQGTGKPKKMVIEGDNKKDKVYILYNEIIIKK